MTERINIRPIKSVNLNLNVNLILTRLVLPTILNNGNEIFIVAKKCRYLY